MSPDEADERITLSRFSLSRYRAMLASGIAPVEDLNLIEAELQVLATISTGHPQKAGKLIGLVADWASFRDQVRKKTN